MIPALVLVAGVVIAASLRGRARRRFETHVGDYEPDPVQLQQQAAADTREVWQGRFDLLGDVTVTTEAEFMAVGDSFAGLGPDMTTNDSQKLLELMFWATKPERQWGT